MSDYRQNLTQILPQNHKIPVAVSQCLLGDNVRYDGGHKRSLFICNQLSQFFEFRPICPEVAIGLGIPRKPIRLIETTTGTGVFQQGDGNRVTGKDLSPELAEYANQMSAEHSDICGYILMHGSPSCGIASTKRYRESGMMIDKKGQGAYAKQFAENRPTLPLEEAGRLNDAGLKENFVARVIAYYDWQQSVAVDPTAARLIAFYSRYKYQVMAHDVPSYKAIGPLLADLSQQTIDKTCEKFIKLFMGALSKPATRKGNTNALMHLAGYLKKILSQPEKSELRNIIDSYRLGYVPLIVPVTLLKHHLMKTDNDYLLQQSFWNPHPESLGLRNH